MYIFTPDQQKVIDHYCGPLLVDAGAGSGKTSVILERARILSDKYGAHNVVLFSFTKAATMELIQRFMNLSDDIPLITTIHSWSWSICRSVFPDLQIANEKESLSIISRISGTTENVARNYLQAIMALKNGKLSKNLPVNIDTLRSKYDRSLRDKNMADFTDMMLLGIEALQQRPGLLRSLHNRFRHIIVDEFQDVNPLQYQLIRSIVEGKINPNPHDISNFKDWNHRSFTVVGDSDQCIYGFRGADSRIILAFKNHFSDANVISLNHNFRCSQEIVDVSNGVISFNEQRTIKQLVAAKGYINQKIEIFGAANLEDETDEIARRIKFHFPSHNKSNIAVLCRLNRQHKIIAKQFSVNGIQVQSSNHIPNHELPEHKQMLGLLRIITNPYDIDALNNAISTEHLRENIISIMDQYNCSVLSSASFLMKRNHKAGAFFNTIIKMGNALWCEDIKIDSFKNALMIGFDRTNWVRRLAKVPTEPNIRRLNLIIKLINNIENVESKFINTYEQVLQSIESPSIIVSTIHGAKGCEYDEVYLVGLDHKTFPDPLNDLEEERRLLYVGLTRAKQKLTLSFTANNPGLFVGDVVVNLPNIAK